VKIKRRTKIITETERRFSFDVRRKAVLFFCADCDAQGEMLSINQAAQRLKTTWRTVVRSIENGELHSTETEVGEIYVCAASLSNKG
jgi:hypothetical protein